MTHTAKLILRSGETFRGTSLVHLTYPCFGEVVFNTGMTGYVESLTDPSYAGQILVFTYPLIGNYGVSPRHTWESSKIQVKAVIVAELSPFYSSHEAEFSLADWLIAENIPCLIGVDTRALTKCLREQGVSPGVIADETYVPSSFEDFEQVDWVRAVSIKTPVITGQGKLQIIVVDCGIKENTLRHFSRYPFIIKRVPYDYDYSQEDFDGVFISNGPGDPMQCQRTIGILKKVMKQQKPIFGICLGAQLMALASGASTYKLAFGHRSHNQPCLQVGTARSYLTSQNHGYAINGNTLTSEWRISFRNLNDGSVAGI